jgi:phytoene synthase
MGAIVAAAREPTIGAMRLLWWRDALISLDMPDARIPAEPLLRRIAVTLLPAGLSGTRLSAIEEGWSALLDDDAPDAAAIALHAEARGAALFTLAAELLGKPTDDMRAAGQGWALADLGHRTRDLMVATTARNMAAERLAEANPSHWPRALRPLGLLTLLAARDARSATRRQGSPARVFRAALYGLTGF